MIVMAETEAMGEETDTRGETAKEVDTAREIAMTAEEEMDVRNWSLCGHSGLDLLGVIVESVDETEVHSGRYETGLGTVWRFGGCA